MESHYQTLHTLYTITHQDPQPSTYQCRPREIILRQLQDWSIIYQHLHLLEQEGYVVTNQKDTLLINITAAGIQKIIAKTEGYAN